MKKIKNKSSGQIYFLKGNNVILDPIEDKDVPKIAGLIGKWTNDPVVTYYLFTGQRPKNKKQAAANLRRDLESENNIIFLAVDKKTKKPIGYAGLYDINLIVRKAEFRILIGEKDFWGKGYGTEITELITFYGFDRIGLNRIYLGYTSAHDRADKTYKKVGYVYEGTRREDLYRNSTYYDSVIMAILRKDYYKNLYHLHVNKFFKKYESEK
ncbi:MAG: GNAT family protein [Patescibacteria group bacterium]